MDRTELIARYIWCRGREDRSCTRSCDGLVKEDGRHQLHCPFQRPEPKPRDQSVGQLPIGALALHPQP